MFKNLRLIPLDLPKEGFHHFLCAWLYRDGGTAVLIDPGPRSTLPALLQALVEMKVRHLDYILLTHIHLDHAGGAGLLLERYPDAKVVCHPRGVPHLLNPDKLWDISLKVLLGTAALYGKPSPVPEKNLQKACDADPGALGIEIYETPGHAPHHLCYRIGDLLFTGEAAGIFYPLDGKTYLRIAAPPGFEMLDYRRSLERLREVDASVVCYGHWGWSTEIRWLLDTAAAQMELWAAVVEQRGELPSPRFESVVLETLLAHDPGLSCFHQLPADVRKRETFFMHNSFRGIRMALKRKGGL